MSIYLSLYIYIYIFKGDPLQCLRLTFVGELDYELHCSTHAVAARVYNVVKAAGVEYEAANNVPVRDAGYRAMDSLSGEKSMRHWHADLSNRDTPMEAGIGFTVLPKLKIPCETEEDIAKYDFLGYLYYILYKHINDMFIFSILIYGLESLLQ